MEQKRQWGDKDQEAKRRGANYSNGSKKVKGVQLAQGQRGCKGKIPREQTIIGDKNSGDKIPLVAKRFGTD